MANYSQAQVFPVLSYANTFSDWVVSTNGLLQQNNDLAANNFTKPSGTLFLGDNSLGLQVNTAAIIAGAFQVQGTGSSAYVQNTLRVGGPVNFTNTAVSLLANGQIQAIGSGTGLTVANNATVSGTLTSTVVNAGSATVSGTFTASANGTANNFAVTNYLNTNALTATGVSTLANAVITTETVATSSITNATIANENVANSTINILVANNVNVPVSLNASSIISSSLSVTGQTYVNNITANGQFSVGGNFVINGTTVYNSNTFTLNAGSSTAANSFFNVNRGSSGTNASIRWNEGGKYFDILDVGSGTYYAITTTKTPSNITFTGSNFTSAVTSNGVISFTSNNGVVTTGTSNTFTINTPQDLRTTATPTFNALALNTALPISSGGTGATSAGSALTNILPAGTTAGYVLTTGGPGNFYWAAGGGGGGGATPGTSISSTYLSYSANGSGITYTTPTYIPGADQLKVYVDGVRQFPGTYTETTNTSVSFSTSPPSGSNILVEVDGYFVNPYYANNIAYTINSSISSTANTIQLAIDGLTSKVVSNYANTLLSTTFANTVTFSNTVTLSSPLSISSGGTGGTSSTAALNNLLPSGQVAGYVLTTGGSGSYYWTAGGGGGGGGSTGTTIQSSRIYPTVNAGQTLFTTPTYIPGNSQLRVYVNGVRQFNSDYTETSNTSVTLSNGASSGDIILLEVDGYINNPYYANNIAYTINNNISSTANTIQLAIDGLTSKLVTYYANNTVQNPIDATQNTNIASAASYANSAFTAANNASSYAGSAFTQANGAFSAANTISSNLGTGSNVQHGSLGIGTAASGVSGEIRAANNITAYYSSDISLKENIQDIPNALDIVTTIGGKTFDWKDEVIEARGGEDGYFVRKQDFGVVAQDVQSVFPLAVRLRDDGILAVDYEKMCALAFAAIKELKAEIDMLKGNSK